MGRTSPLVRFIATLAASAAVLAVAPLARAQTDVRTPLGVKKTLVIDELSGFRASTVGGVSYAGPIGISVQSLSENLPSANPAASAGSTTTHFTNIWFAPSADYFVIDHLSIGGLIEITSTSSSQTTTLFASTSTTVSLPTTTNVTVVPRVGWMFAVTDRFGIWPRAGLGYAVRTTASTDSQAVPGSTDTFSGFVVDLDVGFLYRVNQTFFLSGRPEITFVPGSHSETTGNTTTSLGATYFQFALTGGVGIMWGL
jgi:hypothetical protein